MSSKKRRGMQANITNPIVAPGKALWKAPKGKWHTLVLLAAVLLATAIVHSNSLRNGFVQWDDDAYVYNNKDIRQLDSQSLGRFFTTYYLRMYQPVTMISYALDYKIGGLEAKTYHRTNYILHLLNNSLKYLHFVLPE